MRKNIEAFELGFKEKERRGEERSLVTELERVGCTIVVYSGVMVVGGKGRINCEKGVGINAFDEGANGCGK